MAVDKSITLPFRPKSEALTTQQFVKLNVRLVQLCNFLLCRKKAVHSFLESFLFRNSICHIHQNTKTLRSKSAFTAAVAKTM